jgi:N-acetylmuramoyl-L-alanine amidase
MQNAKINESKLLAKQIQKSIYFHMRNKYSNVKNRGTKQAPFYVLLGTKMPAVLIATSFISNPTECKRLLSEEYQDDLCEGIVTGIQNFIEELDPIKK